MADNRAWTVLPHGELEALEPNLWRVEGRLARAPMKRVMTVARLASGALVVYSPIALGEPAMAQLDALGDVAFIVTPNGWHRIDTPAYAKRYPRARVLAPAGARKRVCEVATVAGGLDALPADPSVRLVPVAGTREAEAMLIATSGDRTSIAVSDTIFNMPHRRGVGGFVLRHITQSSGGPRVSRLARNFIIKDKPQFAAQLELLATPQLARVIVAHHQVIADDPAAVLRRIAAAMV